MKETLGKEWCRKINSLNTEELQHLFDCLDDNVDTFEYSTRKMLALGKALDLTVYQLGWIIGGTSTLFTFKNGDTWMVLSTREMEDEVVRKHNNGSLFSSTSLSIDSVERRTYVLGHFFYVYKIK